ncbi:MAG: DMT family transporter [Bacillota bacterium]
MNHGILLIAAASALLATNTTMAKFSYMAGLTAPALLLIRYLIGSAAFSTLLRLRDLPIIPPAAGRRTLGAAVIVLVPSLLFLGSASRIPLSLAVVLVFTYPVWTVLLAHLMKLEQITARKAGAVAIAITGIALTVGPDFSRLDPWGVGMAALGGISFGLIPTIARRMTRDVDPMQVNACVSFLGIPVTLALGLFTGGLTAPAGTGVWLTTLGSATFYIAGFALLLMGIPRTEPTRAAVTQTLEPLCTVILAMLILGEPLVAIQLVGAALILVAILTVAWRRK